VKVKAGHRASRTPGRTVSRTVTAGHATLTIKPGHAGRLTVTLTRAAARLLVQRGVLRVRLALKADGKVIATRTITFRHKRVSHPAKH
jgi:hypothetical protein